LHFSTHISSLTGRRNAWWGISSFTNMSSLTGRRRREGNNGCFHKNGCPVRDRMWVEDKCFHKNGCPVRDRMWVENKCNRANGHPVRDAMSSLYILFLIFILSTTTTPLFYKFLPVKGRKRLPLKLGSLLKFYTNMVYASLLLCFQLNNGKTRIICRTNNIQRIAFFHKVDIGSAWKFSACKRQNNITIK